MEKYTKRFDTNEVEDKNNIFIRNCGSTCPDVHGIILDYLRNNLIKF